MMKIKLGSIILCQMNFKNCNRNLFVAKVINIDKEYDRPLAVICKVLNEEKEDYVLVTANEILSVINL